MILILILPFLTVQKINYQAKIKHFNELSAAIQEMQKKTDIALIYQDKEKAKGLIPKTQPLVADISELLKKSPFKNNKDFISLVSNLQEKHQEQQDNINNVKRAKNLKEILDFSKSGFIVNPIGMNKMADYLYFFELESGILYKADLNAENKDLILIFISDKDELRKMVALENGKIALFGQSGKIYLYDGNTNNHSDYSLDPAIPVEKIKDLESFSSNLYILDNKQGNIIKYSLDQAKEGIIKGNSWLLEPIEELKQATSMTIDGSIYVLKTDGLIIKYFRGKKVETVKPLLEIPAVGENKIFTGNDFKNLYISDSKNKRLIVLNQKGELINQYVNDEFANLTDFLVTNNEKEVYLLCNKKVFKLDL